MTDRLTAAMISQAAERLRPVVRRTALEPNERLSGLLGGEVLLKREDAQVCRSYKVRGAFNLIASLTEEERRRGVVCASAGNHGQGVAFACARLGIDGRVYVPSTTPRQKRERIAALGGDRVEIVVGGGTYDEASGAAHADSERTGAVYVHPFDDVRTMAGQGTVGLEILAQCGRAPHTVVVPVGGGGLISGVAVWLREHSPATRIVGAEPAGAASMRAALDHGGPVPLPELDTFVDGAAVGRVGEATYPLVKDLVDEIVAVDEGAVCTEMLDLYQSDGIIAEPAGALAGAAARELLPHASGGPVVCVVSGGNNDVSRYNEVLERSLVHIGLRHYFLVTFPQRPGALRHFLDEVLGEGEDIIAFEYVKKNNRETGPALVGIELERAGDLDSLLSRMKSGPLTVERIPPGSPLFTFIL
ncbi:threonine ammonia-lyase IlvA [Nonomuraea sp. NPDC050783]|uniref:threonine ammonia-lyase IlvA n=1 Tax=Nonomuraea sp. NPDC050783 TaxID=3154634 RepID=UPI00346633D8